MTVTLTSIANAEASGSAGGNDSLVGRLPQHLIAAVSLLRRPGPPAAARQYAGTCADLADDAGPVTETA